MKGLVKVKKVEKWWEHKEISELLSIMSKLAHESVAYAIHVELEESEKLEKEFMTKFDELIPEVVEMKTEYWAYRHNNSVYDNWDKLQVDLWGIRRYLENKLEELYLERENNVE
jgi:hypothetical protein